jgi:hypothetical protein
MGIWQISTAKHYLYKYLRNKSDKFWKPKPGLSLQSDIFIADDRQIDKWFFGIYIALKSMFSV